jgi:hypothetical protein
MALAARTTIALGSPGKTQLMQLGTQLWLKKLNSAVRRNMGKRGRGAARVKVVVVVVGGRGKEGD